MITQHTIESTDWTAITTAGQSGTCWIKTVKKGSGTVFISHGSSQPASSAGYRLVKSKGNDDMLELGADDSNDIFYARVGEGDSVKLITDVL